MGKTYPLNRGDVKMIERNLDRINRIGIGGETASKWKAYRRGLWELEQFIKEMKYALDMPMEDEDAPET